MRESSKRPSMALVFFTRPGHDHDDQRPRDSGDAHQKLLRLAQTEHTEGPTQPVAVSPWERHAQLARDDDGD
jgi:hypothetical protein